MNKPTIIGIIPARTDSSRLPGKVLETVGGMPLIGYVIERALMIPGVKEIILATTNRAVDDRLSEYAVSRGISVYRGDLSDVAQRLLNCAIESEADYFIRLNGDSPFLDPSLIAEGIEFCSDKSVDLVTNLIGRTFPYGIAVEIIRTQTYEHVYKMMSSPADREHVTKYLYDNIEEFKIQSIMSPFPELSKARLVVDTEDDLKIFEKIVSRFGEKVSMVGFKEVASLYLNVYEQ